MGADARSIALFIAKTLALTAYTIGGAALALVALPITLPIGAAMTLRGINAIVEEVGKERTSEEDVSGLAVIFALASVSAFLVFVPMAPLVHQLSLCGRAVDRLRNE